MTANDQLNRFVTTSRSRRLSDAQIKSALIAAGWSASDIKAALNKSDGLAQFKTKKSARFQKLRKKWLLWLIVLILLIQPILFLLEVVPGLFWSNGKRINLSLESAVQQAVQLKNPSICEKVAWQGSPACGAWPCRPVDACYVEVGKGLKDANLCALSRDGWRECMASIIESTDDAIYCDRLGKSGDKVLCYVDAATKYNQYEACFKSEDLEVRDQCIGDFVSRSPKAGIALCELIKSSEHRGYCYLVIGRRQKNPSLCDKIIVAEIRNNCLSDVKKCKESPQLLDCR